jgi:Trk K+ transport system NAD-binding subunit
MYSEHNWPFEIRLEPLLMCITGAYVLTNYSENRQEFAHILEYISPIVYVVFFTYTGASLSLEVVSKVFFVALLFFGLRIFTLFLGGVASVFLAKDNPKFALVSWMPYVTQAGVALGLTTLVKKTFPEWGVAFESIIIAIVVLNQVAGPPLFKWALGFVKETHTKHQTPGFDGIKDVYIFGLENQSLILAAELAKKGWEPKIFTLKKELDKTLQTDVYIKQIPDISLETLKSIDIQKADRVLCLLDDDNNYLLTERIFEKVGIDKVIVRLQDDKRAQSFIDLGAMVLQPSLAMINLMDHMLRAPNTTSFLLGVDNDQDTLDIPINNKDLVGIHLRDLQVSQNVVILSIYRDGGSLVPHGYTTLKYGDIMAVAGPTIEIAKLFEDYSGNVPFVVSSQDY